MPLVQPGFSVLSDEFAADPYRHFARLRERAPVHYEPAIDSYFLSRHQDVRRVLTDHQAFTTKTLQARAEPVMRGPVLAQMTGAEHTAKRKIVIRGVTGEALRDQVRAARASAAELLAPLLARGRMDLVNDFGKPFAIHVTLDAVELTSRGRSALITGDCLHHPVQFAHPAIGACVDIDPEQSEASRRTLLDSLADTDTLVLGTHFSPPTAGRVVTHNGAYRFSPLSTDSH